MVAEILYKELSYAIVGAAIEVHRTLGSAFVESVYELALAHELDLRGIPYERQTELPVFYKDKQVGWFKADFVVDGRIIPSTGSGQASSSKPSKRLTKSMRPRPTTTLRQAQDRLGGIGTAIGYHPELWSTVS